MCICIGQSYGTMQMFSFGCREILHSRRLGLNLPFFWFVKLYKLSKDQKTTRQQFYRCLKYIFTPLNYCWRDLITNERPAASSLFLPRKLPWATRRQVVKSQVDKKNYTKPTWLLCLTFLCLTQARPIYATCATMQPNPNPFISCLHLVFCERCVKLIDGSLCLSHSATVLHPIMHHYATTAYIFYRLCRGDQWLHETEISPYTYIWQGVYFVWRRFRVLFMFHSKHMHPFLLLRVVFFLSTNVIECDIVQEGVTCEIPLSDIRLVSAADVRPLRRRLRCRDLPRPDQAVGSTLLLAWPPAPPPSEKESGEEVRRSHRLWVVVWLTRSFVGSPIVGSMPPFQSRWPLVEGGGEEIGGFSLDGLWWVSKEAWLEALWNGWRFVNRTWTALTRPSAARFCFKVGDSSQGGCNPPPISNLFS